MHGIEAINRMNRIDREKEEEKIRARAMEPLPWYVLSKTTTKWIMVILAIWFFAFVR